MVMILIRISFYIEDPTENIVFMILETHKNSRFFTEALVQILNKADDYDNIKMLLTFIKDYNAYADRFLFYVNDMKIIIDIILRMLGKVIMTEDPGYLVLEVFECITSSQTFAKNPHRRDEIDSMFDEIKDDNDLPESNYDILESIIMSITE